MILNPSHGGDKSRWAVFNFMSGRDVQSLCIDVYDNEDVCEPMAMGNVQLVNGTIIQAVEVSKAAIFIIDDDRKLTWMNWILVVFQMHTLIRCAQNVYIEYFCQLPMSLHTRMYDLYTYDIPVC